MVSKQIFECLKVEEALGWRTFGLKEKNRAKVVSTGPAREIIHEKSGKLVYLLKNTPELSIDEAKLLRNTLEHYRNASINTKENQPKQALKTYCEKNHINLDKDQKKYLKKLIENITKPAGILTNLLEDKELEEIAVIGLGKSKPVYVFDSVFGWLPTNLYFSDNSEIKTIANAMAGTIGRRLTLQNPRLNAVLSDGSRLNVCIEPASVSGPSLTIRKFREAPFTPTDLVGVGSVSIDQLAFLWMAIQADCSLLVCGNTGSGKTTLLNSLLNFVPANERIILVEETPEINVPHKHFVKLVNADSIDLGMQELIVNTLRMRPDRVIVGEIRDKKEQKAFMDSLLAGQGKGCYGTFHAQSVKEAISRMKNLGALEIDLTSLDLIITQKRWSSYSKKTSSEERKLTEICEISEKNNQANIRKLFGYNFDKRKFENENESKKVLGKILRAFNFKKKEFRKELDSRKKILKSLRGKTQGEFFNEIQK